MMLTDVFNAIFVWVALSPCVELWCAARSALHLTVACQVAALRLEGWPWIQMGAPCAA